MFSASSVLHAVKEYLYNVAVNTWLHVNTDIEFVQYPVTNR